MIYAYSIGKISLQEPQTTKPQQQNDTCIVNKIKAKTLATKFKAVIKKSKNTTKFKVATKKQTKTLHVAVQTSKVFSTSSNSSSVECSTVTVGLMLMVIFPMVQLVNLQLLFEDY